MPMALTLLAHALTSLAVMVMVITLYHRWFLAPLLEKQRLALQQSQERAGQQLQQNLEQQLDTIKVKVTDSSFSGTTRQMLRFGSDLMEGGISSFLSGPQDSKTNGHGDR
ncbi:MAG: hypothetical protein EA349_10460 [Halomonadaceae bacterium]|nr:MAG: hypothetical protein EA349_10460 [Halomonadaceae bacterium]